MRPSFGAYSQENKAFRDAASELSSLRDSDAMIETYDALTGYFADHIDASAFSSIRHRLAERRSAARAEEGLEGALSLFGEEMNAARSRAQSWTIEDEGFDAVAGGLGRTYKRARKTMRRAADAPTPANLHEWRKRVKYHWYHARLMREILTCPL